MLVDEMNLGSQEQAKGIAQIARAVAQMEQLTQTTAANSEESAAAAEELTAQSEALKDIVTRLTAMVGGSGGQAVGQVMPAMRSGPGNRGPGRQSADLTSSLSALHAGVGHKQPRRVLAPIVSKPRAKQNTFSWRRNSKNSSVSAAMCAAPAN